MYWKCFPYNFFVWLNFIPIIASKISRHNWFSLTLHSPKASDLKLDLKDQICDEEKLQIQSNQNNRSSMTSVSVNAELVSSEVKKSRRKSSISVNQLSSTTHRLSMPFSNTPHAVFFKKGNVVRGILCPSLTNSFRLVIRIDFHWQKFNFLN